MDFIRNYSRKVFLVVGGLALGIFPMTKWNPLKGHNIYAMQPDLEIIKDNKDARFEWVYFPWRCGGSDCESIVFVHGLNVKGEASYARNAWTADVNRERIFWPGELLPSSIPSVRVLLFAYNSSITWNSAVAGVKDHATTLMNLLILKRKVVFVS